MTNSTRSPTATVLTVGTRVVHQGEVGGVMNPIGIILRPKRFNALLETPAYAVQFDHGYFQVAEANLRAVD